ncbi:hypothetical protein ES705_40666 [subsurface metagenome]
MAIRSRRNFKTVIGALDTTVTAKPGESILVTDVRIYEPTAAYTNFLIQRTSVGHFRVVSLLGSHLHFHPGRAAHAHGLTLTDTPVIAIAGNAGRLQNAGAEETAILITVGVAEETLERAMNIEHTPDSQVKTILAYLREKGVFAGYPVGEGETFTVQLITGGTSVTVVEYDIYDAGDMVPEMPNGSKGESYLYLNYGDSGANIQAVADNTLGVSNNPAEYPNFPFGGNVPADSKIELIGILASDVAPALNDAAACTYTQYLKLMQGRTVLFDEDHNGLLYYAYFPDDVGGMNMIAEGKSVGGNYTQCDLKEPLMFDPPIVFEQGEELTVSWHVVIAGGGGVAITPALQEVALILRLSPSGV